MNENLLANLFATALHKKNQESMRRSFKPVPVADYHHRVVKPEMVIVQHNGLTPTPNDDLFNLPFLRDIED